MVDDKSKTSLIRHIRRKYITHDVSLCNPEGPTNEKQFTNT